MLLNRIHNCAKKINLSRSLITLFYIFSSTVVLSKTKISDFRNYQKTKSPYILSEVINGINYGWGMTFIDEQNLLVTEKGGRILKINILKKEVKEIKHNIPEIIFDSKYFLSGQGGLLDILMHNNFLYLSYSRLTRNKNSKAIKNKELSSTAIIRAKLFEDKIQDIETLLIAKPPLKINKHWGSRIVIKDNHLYASFGDRGLGMIAQDPSKHPGSIIRINIDGSVPKSNPRYKKNNTWLPEIFQIGMRNPQGMTISPYDKEIYFTQHGPRGGDNLGKIQYSGNYGWKDIAWGGTEYYGAKIGKSSFKEKYNAPIISWVPSVGVGQIAFYKGDTFEEWNGDIIVSATKAEMLFKFKINNNNIENEEIILDREIGRIRDFEINSKGDIYIILDEKNGSLWKLSR